MALSDAPHFSLSERLIKDAKALKSQAEALQKENSTITEQLKLCRIRMREAGIGHQYPGANPRIEADHIEHKNLINSAENRECMQEMLLFAQSDAARWKAECDAIREYAIILENKLREINPNFKGGMPTTESDAPQILAERFLAEELANG